VGRERETRRQSITNCYIDEKRERERERERERDKKEKKGEGKKKGRI